MFIAAMFWVQDWFLVTITVFWLQHPEKCLFDSVLVGAKEIV